MEGHDKAERNLEDMDKLLYSDLRENSSMLGLNSLPPKLDHCDILLDAMDAQLDQLKVQPPKCCFLVPEEHDYSNAASLRWSQSLSKDRVIGNTAETNDIPMSCIDLMYTPMMEQVTENTAGCWEGPVTHKGSKVRFDRSTSDKEEIESWKEQVIWRLERLLGEACKDRKIAEEAKPPSESICTEDFVSRFKEEMVELTLPHTVQQPNEEKANRIEICDRGICVSDLNGTNVERQGWGNWNDIVMAHSSQSNNPGQRNEETICLSKKRGVNMSPVSQDAAAEERSTTQHEDCGNGVPVWSCDTVSIDSDLNTICSEQVRHHIHKLTGWCTLIQSVTDLNDHYTDQRDDETPTEQEDEPLSTSGGSSSYGCLPSRSLSFPTVQYNGRETWRFVYSLSNDRDTDEDVNHWTSEKMQSDLSKMKEQLFNLQQKLVETVEELHSSTEAECSLRNRCVCLEKKQTQKKEQTEALELQVRKLQLELEECTLRVGVLDKMLTQKEQQLLDLQDTCGSLQQERDELKRTLENLQTKQCKEVKEAREQTHTMMINKQAEEEKVNALKEETLLLTQHIESLQSSIQLKEEDVNQLRKCLQQEKEMAEKREEEFHAKVLEKVHKAAEEERKMCETERVEAVEKHCGILEEQNRRSLEKVMSEMQQEKSKSLTLQHQVAELKTKMQELKSKSCTQQREQESLLLAVCKSLKEEHQAELQRSQTHIAQQSQQKALLLEQDVRLAVEESARLRVVLEERERSHKLFTAEMERQFRHWAQHLEAECRHLHLLVERRAEELPQSLTVAESFTHLRTLREQLKHFISHLHQELDSQKRAKEQLRRDMEQQLSIQRQQLRIERDQALNSVKEHLIQEHIEELSSLKWAHMGDGGVAASLRRQLKAKDLELRQVQRSMAQWKERAAARLACKFKEELTTELERKSPKTQEVRLEGETKPDAKEDQNHDCASHLHAADSHSPSDLASFKLLSYLQSRVKQLRVEDQAFVWSPPPQYIMPLDLSEFCFTTVTHSQDSAGILSQSSIRTV